MPKVSVIVPNYNHAPYLKKRFDSIFAQTYQDFELIILDDCSTDNSREVLDKYRNHPKVSQFVYNEKNSGSTFKQWNKGVALAKGEYIWIAESDDEAEPEFLETLVPKLDANSNVGIAYCQSFWIDEESKIFQDNLSWTNDIDNERWKKDYLNDGRQEIESALVYKNTIPNASAVVFRKNVFLKAGGGFVKMRLCGDWMTWFQMLQKADIYYSCKHLNRFRFHTQNARTYTLSDLECIEFTKVYVAIYKKIPNKSENVKQHIAWQIKYKYNKGMPQLSLAKKWVLLTKVSPDLFILDKKIFWSLWREFLILRFRLRAIKNRFVFRLNIK